MGDYVKINEVVDKTLLSAYHDELMKGVIAPLKRVVRHDTTDNWNATEHFIPQAGEIIIYDDYRTVGGVAVPGVKIGSGNADVKDLAFLDAAVASDLLAHISDSLVHVSSADRLLWNSKLNVDDSQEVVEETLIFNRN